MLIFAYRHHVYELVIKSVFDVKFSQETTSPDSPLFKKYRDNWNDKIQYYREKLASCLTVSEIDNFLELYQNELTKEIENIIES